MGVSTNEDTLSAITPLAVSDQSKTAGIVSVANQIHGCSHLSAGRSNPSSKNERAPIADGGLPSVDPSLSFEAGKADDVIPPKKSYDGSLYEQAKMSAETEVVEDVKGEVLVEGTEAVGGALNDDGPSDALAAVIGDSLMLETHGREDGGVMLVETPLEAVNGVGVEQKIEEGGVDDVVSYNIGLMSSVPKADGMNNETEQMQAVMDVSSILGRPEKGEAVKIEM